MNYSTLNNIYLKTKFFYNYGQSVRPYETVRYFIETNASKKEGCNKK